jgi:mercuric reductase
MQDCCSKPKPGNGSYDLAVIGAGSAGFSAAITGVENGARVALIGSGTIGGTCVNTGCVPSKTMIRGAEALHAGAAAGRFAGLEGTIRLADWRAFLAQKDALVAGLRKAKYLDLLRAYPEISYVEGLARLAPDGRVLVDGEALPAAKTIITTGAAPDLPPIPGIEQVPYLTSTTALELERLPGSLLVIGGGYIGCELGQLFARMGVRVTIVDLVPILSLAEPEVSRALADCLAAEVITLREGVWPQRIGQGGAGVVLEMEANGEVETVEAEQVLVTTGRRPTTAGLGLEEAGVRLLPGGGIKVDERMRTTRPGVYAAGDVTGRDMFVYMAAHGAKIAALNALTGDGWRYDDRAVPAVVFTDPQVAMVGLTEQAARAQGLDVRTSLLALDQVPRALAARDTRGLVKLVADRATGRLLGAHILAPEGADSIQTAALAIRHGMTVQELGDMIFPYLTTVEALKLAAQGFAKDVAKLSCCAG